MDHQQWNKVNEIVDSALELEEPERSTYVEQECGNNEQLKSQVTRLLESIEKSSTEGFLEQKQYPEHLMADLSDTSGESADKDYSLVGQTIDQYQITGLIGHGGMGSVYLAERSDEAYEQTVAFKGMRRGMDTPSNIARFKRERQILASLEHPNIARLLDGGVTPNGLPYLVMEYVKGTPLYDYCDDHTLSIKERLELFRSVCKAIQHAHKNAVIHRDLKPSNIMVNRQGQIKILDFGIAKLLEPENPEQTLYQTQTGARLLTLGYAAPEQIEAKSVTTATDTYTLGIVLYELLAGVHPFDLDDKDLTEIEQLIRTQTPATPRDKYRGLPEKQQRQIAKLRKITPAKLSKRLQGDLDAIVMKALRKEPEDRYDSARELQADLDRREQNLLLAAREDTWRYKTKKFFKRHKTGLSVAAGFLLLIIGFAGFYTWQITQERNRARMEAEKAQQVSDYLVGLFESSNPLQSTNSSITAKELLDKGLEDMSQLADRPAVKAQMLDAMGRAQLGLGHYEQADSLISRALSIRRQLYEPPHPDLAASLDHRAQTLQSKGDFAAAESLARKAVEMRTTLWGETHPDVAGSLHELAFSLKEQGKFAAAESLYRKALRIQRNVHDSPHKDIASTLNNLGQLLTERGEYAVADSLLREALAMRQKLWPPTHPKITESYNNLAQAQEGQGHFTKAESLYRKVLTIDRKTLGPNHPYIATGLNNLAVVVERQGHLAEAESLKRQSLALRREILGADHPDVTTAMNNLAVLLRKKGQYEKAASLFHQVLKRLRQQYDEEHPYVAFTSGNLGDVLREQGQYAAADSLYQITLEIMKNAFHKRHPHVASTLERIANLRKEQKRYQAAEAFRRQAIAIRREQQGNHPETAESLKELADLLIMQEKTDKAERLYREALTINKNTLGEDDWRVATVKSALGECLVKEGNYVEAEPLLKEAAASLKEDRGIDDRYTQLTYKRLADLYDAWDKSDQATAYRDKLAQ